MRIRTVKPELWQSETLASIPHASRLVAIALLNFADDAGFFWALPKVIRGALFPFDDDSTMIRRALDELSTIGFIRLGETDGKPIGKVENFLVHQKIDRPQKSKLSGLDIRWNGDSTNARRMLDEPSSTEGKGREGKGMDQGREGIAGAPSAATWLEYRKIEFPWWPDCDAESAYAYYEGSGWQGVNLKFWQAKVRACATRWKEAHQAEFGEFARKAKARAEPRTGGFLAIEEERKAIQARIAAEKAIAK